MKAQNQLRMSEDIVSFRLLKENLVRRETSAHLKSKFSPRGHAFQGKPWGQAGGQGL